jgi:SPP1 family predicted phage head-tail adaptor
MNLSFFTAGSFNRRIFIEAPVQVVDEFGQAQYGPQANEGSWSTVIECWAKISPIWGQELERSGKDTSQLWVTIDIRYRAGLGVTRGMRVRDKQTGERYDITAVMAIDFARTFTELTAVKIE